MLYSAVRSLRSFFHSIALFETFGKKCMHCICHLFAFPSFFLRNSRRQRRYCCYLIHSVFKFHSTSHCYRTLCLYELCAFNVGQFADLARAILQFTSLHCGHPLIARTHVIRFVKGIVVIFALLSANSERSCSWTFIHARL